MRMQGDSPESEFMLGDDGSEAESSLAYICGMQFYIIHRRKGYGIS